MNFTKDRFDRLKPVFEDWWEHRLERPVIQVSLDKSSPDGGDYFATDYRKKILDAMYDFSIAPEQVAEAVDRAYDAVDYLGDALPAFYMRPTGVLGGFLGQSYSINHEQGTVWFEQQFDEIGPIGDIVLDESNPLFQRALALTKAVQEHFDGSIAIGIPDLGGVMDVVSAMRDACPMMLEMITDEDAVKDACMNIHRQSERAYRIFMDAIDVNKIPGYTCWATMLSQKPYFVLQNDFSAMIGPDMYDDFYLPILREECASIPRTIYHLDGPNAVRHLDSILTVEELDGVQWVNGAGSLPLDQWPDIYKKTVAAGKLCQVFISGSAELKYIDYITELLGSTRGLCFICTGKEHERAVFEKYLDKYGII